MILCHISHVYPAGASLYFTVGAAAAADPSAQWSAAKRAAGDAMIAAGATITHHHGVGRDHAPWLADEIGALGVAALRAVKRALDPAGIMNPGVLFDAEETRWSTLSGSGKLAELAVRTGANVQPGQIVVDLDRAGQGGADPGGGRAGVPARARSSSRRGTFDPHLKRLRALHADPDTLGYVPPWIGESMLALGEHRAARIALHGVVEPDLMADVDPERLGRDMLPRVKESTVLLDERTTNWNIIPAPTPGWAALVYPDLEPDAALDALWQDIVHICRLDEADPAAAWRSGSIGWWRSSAGSTSSRLDACTSAAPGPI